MMSNDRGCEPEVPQPRKICAQYIRGLLDKAGVRFTITRLKVVEAFLDAATSDPLQASGVSPQEIHRRLADGGEPLSMLNMRQVLRRLVDKGLLLRLGRGRYCLNPGYVDVLNSQADWDRSAAGLALRITDGPPHQP